MAQSPDPSTDLPILLSSDWLARNLDEPDVKIVDASSYLPTDGRDTYAEFLDGHIPGAVFFDIESVADQMVPLPHTVPAPEDFAMAVGALGIANADRVVVYDSSPFFSAPRCWWMFKYFGHDQVAVLDGGLPKWRREHRPLASGPAMPGPTSYSATPHPEMIADLDAVRAASENRSAQIVDARGAARFTGSEREFRPGVRSGHIPGARNVPYTTLLGADGLFLPRSDIQQRFVRAGVDLEAPVITSCGSGVTAAALAFGLALLGKPARLYDGSWTEWGGRDDLPLETGPADESI